MVVETTRVTSPVRWPLPDRPDLRDRLLEAYATGRGYHDVRHLTEVLDRIAELGEASNTRVVLAAWYHDAVYDDQAEAEERSAQLAERELDGPEAAEVARLVRLTKAHRPAAGDRNGEVLCDADLAILAAPRDRYEEYVAGVRREYAMYDDATFARGRLAVLRALLSKTNLFHTPYAREHWEQAARQNVESEIEHLREWE
jgi:predicted metal-dependent HD superfamily phosphohydrolase